MYSVNITGGGGVIKGFHSLNKNIANQKVLIQKQQESLNKQQSEFSKLQNVNKLLSQAIADIRDELLERPIDIEAERAKFAKNLETDLTVEKLTPEQKKEYDLYDSTLKWLKKNGIKFYFFEAPHFAKIKNLDEFYKVKRNDLDFAPDKNNGLFEKVFTCPECIEFINQNIFWDSTRYFNGKIYLHKDIFTHCLKIINGYRNTCYNRLKNSNSIMNIYFYGPCIVFGLLTSDQHTIPSFLSSFSNKINVYNKATVQLIPDIFYQIRQVELKKDDINIAIHYLDPMLKLALKNNDIPYFELSHLFNGPNNYGYCFRDEAIHCNCMANKVIAKYIYKILKPEIEKYDEATPRKYVRMDDINDPAEKAEYLRQNPDLKKYLDSLTEIKKKQDIKGNVGSIVMNCNPFTLGHRYLIETAAKQVDKLIIFVVEEDKSVYLFKDRIELVKKGVSDLKNVIVLPSGNFIISLATFPEYFVKGQKQKDKIDPSKDVSLFAKYIAPTMGIKVRFAGEEPYDTVTKQYNDTMRDFFPTYGLKFVEIKRKAIDGKDDFISASKVRKLLEENKWEELKKYVPQTTYEYLESLKK